jgi:DNA gyrase/topoisomerase IV subunit A
MATKDKDLEIGVTELLARFMKRPGAVVSVPLQQTAEDSMKRYGFETVLNRALPDWRTGLIPVRQKTLWAMFKEHNDSKSKRQKSARAVGNTIAKYHPHGDVSVYGAIVSMVNAPEAILDGEGNWGGPTSEAAAMRYTNVRLSKYADAVFFDSRFLPLLEFVPNYDGTTTEPVLLPALLPNILINGLDAGIGVGVSGCIPPFKKEGVKKLVQMVLQGKTLTPKICYDTLEFNYQTGCTLFTDDQPTMDKLVQFFKTGRGSAVFVPRYEINKADRIITILGTAPMVNAQSILEAIGKNEKDKKGDGRWDHVVAANDLTDKRSGGLRIEVQFKRTDSNNEFNEWCNDIIDQFSKQINYQINVVENFVNEKGDGDARFRRFTLVDLITEWCDWRTELELRALRHELGQLQDDLRKTELRIAIARNPDAFIKAVRADDEIAAICKLLTCTTEEADWLLQRQIKTLTKASENQLKQHAFDVTTQIGGVNLDIAAPRDRIMRDLKDL